MRSLPQMNTLLGKEIKAGLVIVANSLQTTERMSLISGHVPRFIILHCRERLDRSPLLPQLLQLLLPLQQLQLLQIVCRKSTDHDVIIIAINFVVESSKHYTLFIYRSPDGSEIGDIYQQFLLN